MKVNSILYKNEILTKKYLNIDALYDKTNARLNFMEEDFEIIIDLNNQIYMRNNAEYSFTIDVLNETANLIIKDLNQFLELKLLHLKAKFDINNTFIEYKIDTDEEQVNKIVIESSEL